MSTETVDPPFVAETLAWCNERRAEKNLEPLDRLPKGVRTDGRSCPCGKATGLYVYSSCYAPAEDPNNTIDDTPRPVQEFVAAFDNKELPQYDEYPS